MATKSVLKSICIDNRKVARSFVRALEKTVEAKPKEVPCKDTFIDATLEDIKAMFGDKQIFRP